MAELCPLLSQLKIFNQLNVFLMKNSSNTNVRQNNKSVETILLAVLFFVGAFGIYYVFNTPSEDASKKLEDQIVQLSYAAPQVDAEKNVLALQ